MELTLIPLHDHDPSMLVDRLDAFGIAAEVAEKASVTQGLQVIIAPERDPGPVFEVLAGLEGTAGPIWVCLPRPRAGHRKKLVAMGVALISPPDWRAESVCDRILGALFLEIEGNGDSGLFRGQTRSMREIYRQIRVIAPYQDPVLVLGEPGTGKELCASELHRLSKRAGRLIAINCAALSPEMIESELFGHRRGAFTGAVESRKGLLGEARSGTIFLDEIAELKPESQAKLLRVLEEAEVRPVGSNKWEALDTRFVLATNHNLETACRGHRFRRDLYDRIKGLTLTLPPLRARKADIPLLVSWFVDAFNREWNRSLTVPSDACDILFHYDWRGNVRELRGVVRKAAMFAEREDGPIDRFTLENEIRELEGQAAEVVDDHQGHVIAFDPEGDQWQDLQHRAWAAYATALLERHGGNVARAAEQAGLSRSVFYEKMKILKQK